MVHPCDFHGVSCVHGVSVCVYCFLFVISLRARGRARRVALMWPVLVAGRVER